MPDQASQPGLSIVIPSWNGRALLEKFLPSVVRAMAAFETVCGMPAEILVADDASTDDTQEWLRVNFPQVRVDVATKRQGFAPNTNRGVRAARFGWVYILNNDVALEPDTLPPLVPHFTNPNVFAVAGQVYDYETGVLHGAGQRGEWRRGFLGVHNRFHVPDPSALSGPPILTLWGSGGSVLYDREKFLALGGFEEMFAPFGWEDVELCLRAWKQGFEVHYEPQSAVWHQFSSTIKSRFSQRHVKAIYERNRLWAHWMHLDTPVQAAVHVIFLFLILLTSPVAGRWENWSAFGQALSRWGEISERRKKLISARKLDLSSVLEKIAGQLRRAGVSPLRNHAVPVRAYPSTPAGQ